MKNPNTIVNMVGIAFGLALVLATFAHNKLLSAMRIDARLIKDASEKTGPPNLVFGLAVIVYAAYSLMRG